MNAKQITEMCKEIYRDYAGSGRTKQTYDNQILAIIMYMYNYTEIDWEEVKWLWMEYLRTGNLDFPEAIRHARERIQDEEDIRATEEELIYWLHKGI